MQKKNVMFLIALIVLTFSAVFSAKLLHDDFVDSEPITVNESNNGKEYTVKVGQTFDVSLASNPSTGYGWTVSEPSDEKVLSHTEGNYRSSGDSNKPISGQGGRTYWEFTALKAGKTEIKMIYARPWESVQPAQTFTLKVMVNE